VLYASHRVGQTSHFEVKRAHFTSVVTKALDVETETKTEASGCETESKTETVASETEAKTDSVYLETEAEAQGSCPILFP